MLIRHSIHSGLDYNPCYQKVCPIAPSGDGFIAFGPEHGLRLELEPRAKQVLDLCDGLHTDEEIAASIPELTSDEVRGILYTFLEVGIISSDKLAHEKVNSYLEASNATLIVDYLYSNDTIKNCGITTFKERDDFFGGYAYYGNCPHKIAGATGKTAPEALMKACVEAYERKTSSDPSLSPNGAIRARACDFDEKTLWLDPRIYAPLSDEQIKRIGLTPFAEETPISWVKGFKVLRPQEEVFIPLDIVYYDHPSPEIYYGNSSGIAAYPNNFSRACEAALCELFERDALMRTWFTKTPPTILTDNPSLPRQVEQRIAYWKSRGRVIHVLWPDQYDKQTCLVAITGDAYPYFVCGASHNRLLKTAIEKALDEAEYSLLLKLREAPVEIEPEEVLSPLDHGNLYAKKEYADQLSWLFAGEPSNAPLDNAHEAISENAPVSPEALDLTIAYLTDPKSEIPVVKAFSPKLIPIAFGYGRMPYAHPEVGGTPEMGNMPHFFA